MDSFPSIRFTGTLRPSQIEVVEIAKRQLASGERKIHVVAPPGSGKTVLGLYLWAECIRLPALVLSPNSAIQAQWVDRLDLFDSAGSVRSIASTDSESPKLFTSLTYQAVTMPHRGGKELNENAIELWIEKLVVKGHAKDPDEAEVWIDDLKRHNRSYYDGRLSCYRKELRDEIAIGGEAMQTLHASALDRLERLKRAGVGLLILDECHHLLSHWGRVLADAHRYFNHPIVIGLTATPPDMRGKPPKDVKRYKDFFGPVDYEVPVPAVVKDGFLAPYQDLVQLVRPTPEELAYIANADDQLFELVEQLCEPFAAPSEGSETAVESVPPTSHSGEPEIVSEPFSVSMIVQELGAAADLTEASVEETQSTPAEMSSEIDAPSTGRESLTEWLTRVLTERRIAVGTVSDWRTFAQRDPGLAWAGPRFLQARKIPLPPGVPQPPGDLSSIGSKKGWAMSESNRLPLTVLIPVLSRYIRRRLRRSSDPADHQLAEEATRRLRMLGTQITETGNQACASPIARVMAYARGKSEAIVPILQAEREALGESIRAVVVADYEKTSAVTAAVSHLLDEEAGGAIAAFRTLLNHPETDALDPILVTGSTVLVDDDLAPRFDAAASEWLAERRYNVELDFSEEDGFHVVSGHGADWCPRVYVAMVTELFQRGITKCLVGTRGLLGEGWDASKINVLIDLTTVTTSTSVNQLRGRSLRLDPDDPQKLAHNWDVICIAPEFVKGLDDYRRFIDKHNTLFGLTDDGLIEKGVGHVHAALTEIEPELVEESMSLLNTEMLQRPRRRAEFRELWRIGEPYRPDPIYVLELLPGGGGICDLTFPYAKPEVDWNPHSLTQAIGRAVLGALSETRLVKADGDIYVEKRAGGYIRAFLENASEKDSKLFNESLGEAMGPLDSPRYVIRRFVDYRISTWLSRILPDVIGCYFQRQHQQMEMLHAVPKSLAKNKQLAATYGRHWNAHVSPGQPVFTRSEEGLELVQIATQEGNAPIVNIHHKEVFL